MSEIETKEALRALTNSVKTLAEYTLGLHRHFVLLYEDLKKSDPELQKRLEAMSEMSASFPTIRRLIDNIDALLQQLEKR